MKLFVTLMVLAAVYLTVMLKSADLVVNQTNQLQQTYQYVADNSEQIATGN